LEPSFRDRPEKKKSIDTGKWFGEGGLVTGRKNRMTGIEKIFFSTTLAFVFPQRKGGRISFRVGFTKGTLRANIKK